MEQVFCLFVFTICVRVSLSALGLNCLIRQRASYIPGHLPTAPSMALQGLPVTSFPRFFFLNLQPEPGRQGVGGDCCPGGCTYLLGKEPSFICFLADARKESRHKMLLKKLAEDARKLNQNICECITESTYSESLGLPFPRAGRVAFGC